MMDILVREMQVAYFSMEIALHPDIPTYAGGLGILAGDTLRSAADLNVPLVGVTLVSRHGYFRQRLDANGRQHAESEIWSPDESARPLDAKVAVQIEGRAVWIAAWLYVIEAHMGGRTPVILLDTDLRENHEEDRKLTDCLYGGDDRYRLKQEVILGIGGVRMLRALGIDVRQYHLNEGHSALLGVELLQRHEVASELRRPGEPRYDLPRVRELCCFTTHTPVEAGHDQFAYALVEDVLGEVVEWGVLRRLAGEERMNMTRLALNLSEYVNGVAKRHAEVSRAMFSGYTVHAVTNGIHPFTWAAPPFRELYDAHLPGWCHEPELLARAECCIADEAVWAAHVAAKQALLSIVESRTGVALDPELPILGFARRMTAYKRPDLLFSDLERLRQIANEFPFQIVMGGKAHPRDEGGQRLIEALHGAQRAIADVIPMAYLPNYEMALAQILVAGVDVWINTPMRPLEASGTSGMKAALNGVPNLSVLDGWWIEGCIEGVTGWSIGDSADDADNDGDAAALYAQLQHTVLPLYHDDRARWIAVMKGAISKNAAYFHSHRMIRRYATEAYLQ